MMMAPSQRWIKFSLSLLHDLAFHSLDFRMSQGTKTSQQNLRLLILLTVDTFQKAATAI